MGQCLHLDLRSWTCSWKWQLHQTCKQTGIKFADNTTVVGLISNNDKEIVVDFRRSRKNMLVLEKHLHWKVGMKQLSSKTSSFVIHSEMSTGENISGNQVSTFLSSICNENRFLYHTVQSHRRILCLVLSLVAPQFYRHSPPGSSLEGWLVKGW